MSGMVARILVVDDHSELATLLGTALEGRGHEVDLAGSGEEALKIAKERPPDAAVVDLLLPDMLGTDVVDALVGASPSIPVIAISGVFRGPAKTHVVVVEHGARLFLEKPFSTKALLEGIAKLVGASEVPIEIVEEEALEEALIEEELAEAIEEEDTVKPTPLAEGPKKSMPEETRRRMGFVEDLAAQTESSPSPADSEAKRPVPTKVRAQTAQAVRQAPPGRGLLRETWVPRLIAAQSQACSSGSLVLRQGEATKVLYFDEGVPVYAASNLARDRLLSFAVRMGVLSRDDAGAALEIARESKKKTGQILLEMEVLDRPTLTKLVQDQLRALVWSTFGWREGRYQHRPEAGTSARVGLGLPLGSLVLQGISESLSLEDLREWLAPDDRCLGPGSAPTVPLEELELSGEAAHLLIQADGTKTMKDLLNLAAPMEEKEARALLAAFEALGLLVTREQMLTNLSRVGFLI